MQKGASHVISLDFYMIYQIISLDFYEKVVYLSLDFYRRRSKCTLAG